MICCANEQSRRESCSRKVGASDDSGRGSLKPTLGSDWKTRPASG